MNNQRRKQLKQAIQMLEEAQKIIDNAYSEEDEAMLNLPEGLQDSEKAYTMSDNCDNLQEASSGIDDVINSLEFVL